MFRPMLAMLLLPGVASAHAILLDSQPAVRGLAATGPARITLRFNSRVDQGRSRLALRSGGQEQVLAITPSGAEDVLQSQADLRPGDLVLRWQVLAVDGHITRGEIPFHVDAAGPQAAAPQAAVSGAAARQATAAQAAATKAAAAQAAPGAAAP